MSAVRFLLSRTSLCHTGHFNGNRQPLRFHLWILLFVSRQFDKKPHKCFYVSILKRSAVIQGCLGSFILEMWDMTVFTYPAMLARIQTDFSHCVCRILRRCPVFWYNLTWAGFCEVFIRKAWLFNTHLFVCKWKRLHISLYSPETRLTIATHFFISQLPTSAFCPQRLPFTRLPPSFVSIPRLLASYTCRERDLPRARERGWYHLILLLSETREGPVPTFLSGAYFWFWAGYQVKLGVPTTAIALPPRGVWIKQPARSQFAGEFVSEPQGS